MTIDSVKIEFRRELATLYGPKESVLIFEMIAEDAGFSRNSLLMGGNQELTDYQKEMLKEIMDYANAEKINVLFVCSPSIMDDDNRKDINAAFEYIESNKSEYIDYYNFNTKEMFDTLNIDTKTDFYDEEHLNVYGAVKFTKYLANVISEKYGIKDKRGDEKLKSWDEAYDAYMEKKENMLD